MVASEMAICYSQSDQFNSRSNRTMIGRCRSLPRTRQGENMPILLKTQVESADKTPVTACRPRVGSLCRFLDAAERVPAGSPKTGRCADVRERCGNAKRKRRTTASEFRQREKPQAASRRKSSSSASSTAIRSSSSSRSSPASLARSPTSPRSQRPWETSKKYAIDAPFGASYAPVLLYFMRLPLSRQAHSL